MAWPQRGARGQAPVLRRTLQADATRGVPRLRAWPAKKSAKDKAKTADQREWFRQAQWLTKYLPAAQQAVAMEATAGTPLMPRDLLTMAMAGRLFLIVDQTGKEIWPVAVRQDIQQALDILTDRLGAVLYRSPAGWQGVNPPSGGLAALFCDDQGNAQFRKIAAYQGTYKTLAYLKTGYNTSASTDIPWPTPEYDEAGLWSPSAPTLMTAPGDGLIRITGQITYSTAAATGWAIYIQNAANTVNYAIAGIGEQRFAQVQTPWLKTTPGAGYQLHAFLNATRTVQSDNTWISAEYIPD